MDDFEKVSLKDRLGEFVFIAGATTVMGVSTAAEKLGQLGLTLFGDTLNLIAPKLSEDEREQLD